MGNYRKKNQNRKPSKNSDKAVMTEIARTFRSKVFDDQTEADQFLGYAQKESLSGVQSWVVPSTPPRYRVIWFDK